MSEYHLTDRKRGMLGAWLGLVMGAVYGLVSTTINAVIMPGLPLRVEAGEVVLSMLVGAIGLALTGFVTAYPHSSLRGILLGALAAAFLLVARAFLGLEGGFYERFGLSYILLIFFLPLAAMLLAVTIVLRVGVNWLENALREQGRSRLLGMVRVWGGAVLLAAIVGSFAQMTAAEQEAVRRVHAMIQQGLARSEPLPGALESIEEFRSRAAPDYTLDATTMVEGEEFIIVTARFSNGLVVECLAGRSLGEFLCSERVAP